jgi:hypothetical protein
VSFFSDHLTSYITGINLKKLLVENIYVTGSIDALSNWSTGSAIGPFDNTNTYPVWSKTISIPAGSSFSYKYIKNDGSNVVWESDPNRSTTAPAAGATLTLTDTWR